jgi:signal transduction histidine kinase
MAEWLAVAAFALVFAVLATAAGLLAAGDELAGLLACDANAVPAKASVTAVTVRERLKNVCIVFLLCGTMADIWHRAQSTGVPDRGRARVACKDWIRKQLQAVSASQSVEPAVQPRPTVAPWHARLPLRWRLMVLVATGVTALVFGLSWLQVRTTQRAVEQELTDTGKLTAQALADDLELSEALEPADIARTVHEFLAADSALRAIAVFNLAGVPIQLASTQSVESANARELAARVIRSGDTETARHGLLLYVGHPVQRKDAALAVIVSISLAAAEQAGRQGLRIAMTFAAVMLVLLLFVIDLITRRFVYAPLADLSVTMRRVASGDWRARARAGGGDEFGVVASGLNDMVARLEHFSRDLQARIDEATAQLRLRNQALEDSYQRVLALREALARAERLAAVGQIAARVAHEVGTPLNLISGYVQMLRDDERASERVRARLSIVDEQIARVTTVLRSMLDQARQPLARANVAVPPIIARASEVAEPSLSRAGIELKVRVEPGLPDVEADEVQIELALLTLINNGLDAMPDGGALAIVARPDDGGVAVEVRDTGDGIPPEILPRLFEPWVSSKPVGRGTGLGLSIVRDIVRGHGGTIEVENRPGEGAAFTIRLPAAASHILSTDTHAADTHR